jgi:glycosyltransferase involved in cell wall biosynthesis
VARFVGLHPTTTRLLDELGLAGAGPVMLVPVRITPRKNLELAIRILAELRRGGDDARLIVTGPPDPHEAPGNGYVGRLRSLAATTGTTGAVHLLAADRGRATSIRVVRDLYRVADLLRCPATTRVRPADPGGATTACRSSAPTSSLRG